MLLCGRRERGREARCVSVFSSSAAPVSTGETDGFIVALEEREGGKRGRQAVALLVRWGGRGQLLLLLSLVLLQDYTFLLVHCLHVVPQSSPLGTSVRTKITNMRLCPVVNVHVIVETSSLSERLLTMVATVRPFTTVDPLVSPARRKSVSFLVSKKEITKEILVYERNSCSPKSRASSKSLATVLANIGPAVRVTTLVGHQGHLHQNIYFPLCLGLDVVNDPSTLCLKQSPQIGQVKGLSPVC